MSYIDFCVCLIALLRRVQGRRRKIFQMREATEKIPKIALFSLFQGEGNGKKDRKIALLSLYLLYLYHV